MKNKIELTRSYAIAEVECIHPDYSSDFYTFNVNVEWEEYPFETGIRELAYDIREAIEQKVNHSGFWHEVTITLYFYNNGEVIGRKEI